MVVNLRENERYSIQKIAQHVKMPPSTVANILKRMAETGRPRNARKA